MEKIGKSIERIRETLNHRPTGSLDNQALLFNTNLNNIIKPKNQSDRTCFRNLTRWLLENVKSGKYTEDVWNIVLRFAAEATAPSSRNPAAVFMKILKEEMDYGK
jgi:hypothetical protein